MISQSIIAQPDAPIASPLLAYEPDTGRIVSADVVLPMAPGYAPLSPLLWPMPGEDDRDYSAWREATFDPDLG